MHQPFLDGGLYHIDLQSKSMDWFLYDRGLRHEKVKKKYIHDNHLPFMNKELSKATMLKTKLRNNFLRQVQ